MYAKVLSLSWLYLLGIYRQQHFILQIQIEDQHCPREREQRAEKCSGYFEVLRFMAQPKAAGGKFMEFDDWFGFS